MRFAQVGCLFALSAALQAEVVHLDVVVRDGRSRILRNLEPADFAVRENGAEGTIRSVQAADPRQRRLVSLLFDHLSGEPARLAREAAFELLNASAKTNAWFGVFEFDQTLRVKQSFTGDLKAVRKAIDSMSGKKPAGEDTTNGESPAAAIMRSIRSASAVLTGEMRTRSAATAILALIRGEATQPGRKVIVYFSQGLPLDPKQEGFRVMVSSANRAGVAIYAVDAAALAISHDEEARRAAALQSMIRYSGEESGREGFGTLMPSNIYQQTSLTADRMDRRVAANTATSALAVLTRSTGGFLMENGAGFRTAMRRVAEELTAYYEITYEPRVKEPDGSFRATQVEVKSSKSAVQGREGYFATPDLSGRPASPAEVALLGALARTPEPHDLVYRAAVLRFRDPEGKQPATTVAIEIPANDLKFQQDDSAGVFRARVSTLALVRAADGAIVDRVSGDTPILCPPGLLADVRQRFVSLQKEMELPPGKYTLETVVEDRLAGRFSISKAAFTVDPAKPGLGLSSVTIARAVTPGTGEQRDGGFHMAEKNVQPALDGAAAATATVFFKVYPNQSARPVDVALEVWQGDRRALHSTKKLQPAGGKSLAEVLSLDLSRVPAGNYDLRVIATQGSERAEERTPLVLAAGTPVASLPEDTEVAVEAVAEPKAVPPTAEQQRLLENVRENALRYSQRLPNFICTQATRHMIDNSGNGDWHTVEESSDLLSFYDGQEHYAPLTTRAKAKEGEFPASVSSAGEFGSMLKEMFHPERSAKFAWVRREQLRGRLVQVFSYAVDQPHSRYRVTYRGAQQKAPVFAAFHGLVFVDAETATVLKLTLQTDALAAGIPVRQISIELDYDEIGVADQIYLLPISATLDVRLHKKMVARNEVTFRSYQRFGADSRITFQTR